ncbi:MAG: hypothetical protein KDD44_07705 [Bdellovibrionales bacterium]|nr:hypothetical protein [Bdellovibrionales bacterium]
MASKLLDNVTANGNSAHVKVGEGHGGLYLFQTKATNYDSGVVLPQISADGTNFETALEEDGAASTGLGADGVKLFVVPAGFYYRLNVASIAAAATALNAWVGKVKNL